MFVTKISCLKLSLRRCDRRLWSSTPLGIRQYPNSNTWRRSHFSKHKKARQSRAKYERGMVQSTHRSATKVRRLAILLLTVPTFRRRSRMACWFHGSVRDALLFSKFWEAAMGFFSTLNSKIPGVARPQLQNGQRNGQFSGLNVRCNYELNGTWVAGMISDFVSFALTQSKF